MFEWLENTALATWVGESLWGYPVVLGLHVIGLAIVVGILAVLDVRLLGGFKGIRSDAIPPLIRLAWVGFLINAVSGAALFSSQATFFVTSTPFLVKISCVAVAALLTMAMQKRLAAANGAGNSIESTMKGFAVASLMLWLAAITAGRLIAYI